MIHIKFYRLNRHIAQVALAGLALLSFGANAQSGPQKLPATQLTAGMHLIRAEVAATDSERQIGLMHRPSMAANDGMVFVFEQPGVQCFWMRNTLIPLSAAFIDDTGTIVNIEDMKPQTDDSHCSKKPVRFVLEMNKGWFDKRGFKAGSVIGGAVFKPTAAR
ncbi:DUF192 domain-containing protein [Sphaerotilus sp.]|uniref:DUF192 domain-containing protein n=1 Tax=Sphaerotilus sp. TaxID=2093942 RepID=UPI0034E1C46A